MSTPDYVLVQAYFYSSSLYDSKSLDAGAFVRPIELCYVPKHVVEDKRWSGFNKNTDVFCFTSLGIVPIPRAHMRKT